MGDDNKADLLRFANEYADKDVDLFDLLGVDALTTKPDIHRAWRKRSLKYDPGARAAYEQATKAKLLRRQEREALDREQRRYADDLEAAERAARQQREDKAQRDREAVERERARLAEAQRMRDEEISRQREAEQEMEMLAEAKRRVREKKEEKARRKLAKESMKAAGRPAGPVNGVVLVPGDYVAELGSVRKPYWELVCDKLRAVQQARNLAKAGAAPDELQQAEQGVQEARRRIADAETKFREQGVTV